MRRKRCGAGIERARVVGEVTRYATVAALLDAAREGSSSHE